MMRIRKLRAKRGISTAQLATTMNVTVKAVGKWERGEGYPRAEQLPKLAETLGCKIDELYEREETK